MNEIRLIGNSKEIEEAVEILKQHFEVHHDGGQYKGRNPRYAGANNYLRKLVVSVKPIQPKTGKESATYQVKPTDREPKPDDAVLGGQANPTTEPELDISATLERVPEGKPKELNLSDRDRQYYGI